MRSPGSTIIGWLAIAPKVMSWPPSPSRCNNCPLSSPPTESSAATIGAPPVIASTRFCQPASKLVGVTQSGRARVGDEPSFGRSGAVFEAPALVAGLDDVAVVSETVEQRGGHDLRRAVATNLQKLGAKLEITEAALNHINGRRGDSAAVLFAIAVRRSLRPRISVAGDNPRSRGPRSRPASSPRSKTQV